MPVILYLALLAAAPVFTLVLGGREARRGLVGTTLATGVCATALQLWFEYPDDIAIGFVFYAVVLPFACGSVAGVVATLLSGGRRTFRLPIAAGIIGVIAGLVLGAFVRPFADLDDVVWSLWTVTPLIVVGSSFAVLAATLDRRSV